MIFVNGGTTMRIRFEYVTNLEYEVKALRAKAEAYESGEICRRQKDEYEKRLREKDRIIAELKKELAAARLEAVTVRRNWQQVFDDMETLKSYKLYSKPSAP